MPTVGLVSLGCPKNLVDSEIMLGLLEKAGYRIVQDPAKADVLIVNTCAFIGDAKRESVDTILEMGQYKIVVSRSSLGPHPDPPLSKGRVREGGRCQKLIVTGCLSQRYKNELAKLLPEVDLFVGTGEYSQIVGLLEVADRSSLLGARCSYRGSKFEARSSTFCSSLEFPASRFDTSIERRVTSFHPPQYIHSSSTPRKLATPKHFAYVKIAEGCFHGCSFCVIPKLRGRFRSRPMDDIVAEACTLVKNGARELNLIAQDTTSYGRDLRDSSNIARLIERLAVIDGDFWIRVMYAYPSSITDDFIEVMRDSPKVCRYLDIPIQHINDRILKAMRRPETGRDVRSLIEKLRKKIPDITLRTSLIVGFPGETKAEFKELLDFVREGHFDHLGVFTYSREKGTPAAMLAGQVPRKMKEARRTKIMEAQAAVSKERNSTWLGKIVRVLVEDSRLPSPFGERVGVRGRTEAQAPEIDGVTYINSKFKVQSSKVGEFVTARIVGAGEYDLIGVISSNVKAQSSNKVQSSKFKVQKSSCVSI